MVTFTIACAMVLPALGARPVYETRLLEPSIAGIVAEPMPVASFLQRVVDLTNIERERVGVRPLRLELKLCRAADWMAKDMATFDYFDHLDRSGRRVGDRAYAFGYRAWTTIGENIAAGIETPEAVVHEWLSSPTHRSNLLRPDYTEIGVGFAERSESAYGRYWVQTFGCRTNCVSSQWR